MRKKRQKPFKLHPQFDWCEATILCDPVWIILAILSYQCLAAKLLQLALALWHLALLVLLFPSTRCCCDSLLNCRVTETKI